MAIGSITVDLLAKTGSFETDLNRAAKLSEQRAKDIEKSFTGIATAVAAGAAAAGAAVVALGSQTIDQLAQLDDMTQKTGASVERLSQIQQTATAFGQDFGTIDDAISRLAKGMATVDSETNKTQKALAALGLSARDTGGALRDPADLLVEVAKALQGYEDGASKAALATDLFGKSGAALLPFLNDLSENVDQFKGASAEAAAEAARFQDQLNRMKAEFQGLAQSITADVLPILNRFLETINTIRQTSITGFLFSSGAETDNPGQRLQEINRQLDDIAKKKAELDPSKGVANKLNDIIFGDVADLTRQEKVLQNQKSYLQGVQQLQALANKGGQDQNDRMQGGKSVLNYTTGNAPATPNVRVSVAGQSQMEKDIEAANKLIESLKTQAATFGKSEAEALRYKLTLQGLPQALIDTASALKEQVTDMQTAQRVMQDMEAEYERQQEMVAANAAQIAQSLMTQEQLENDSYNRRIEALKLYGQQSVEAAAESNALIEAENDRHAVALVDIQNRQIADANSFIIAQQQVDQQHLSGAEQLASNLYSILQKSGEENSALGTALFAAMKGIQVAQILVQTEVAAAMVQAGLTASAATAAALVPFPGGQAILAAGIASATAQAAITRAIGYANAGLVAGMAISGQRANGGPVEAGKQYIVGERGREAFIPTTSGMIIPNHVLESGGTAKENITIVNNTRGRIDSVQTRQISATEKALIIDEAISAFASDMSNPNGRSSRAMQRNLNVQRSRV